MYLTSTFRRSVERLGSISIIHVGAHKAEEADFYDNLRVERVLWVEANPNLMPELEAALSFFSNQSCVQALLAEQEGQEVEFYVTNNGQSSSMLPLKDHATIYADIVVKKQVVLRTATLDSLVASHGGRWNVLNLDVQGAELLVLKGGEQTLEGVVVIYTEVNFREMYAGAALIGELDSFLAQRGFTRLATYDTGDGWGDAIYVRKA